MQKYLILLSLIVITFFNCNSVVAQNNEQVPLHPIATPGHGNSSETGTAQGEPQRSPVYIRNNGVVNLARNNELTVPTNSQLNLIHGQIKHQE